jgi:serine/threonine-protein kinase
MERPRRIGDYEILDKLGSGGMGEVHRVRNVLTDRIEAMKVLLPDFAGRDDFAARFLREIKVLAALEHPNIATLRTAFTAGNQLVMIMELVDGESLARRLSRGRLAVGDALGYIDQVLAALDYAHRQGVIHRDVKPSNMLVTRDGVVKLTDFGIARSAGDHTLTAAGATTGSFSYMSPEQVNGQATDARSDVYAIGVSLYEMVTGRLPFLADTGFAVLFAHLNQEPTPPRELEPSLPPELERIILTSMAKRPADRFQTAAELRAALTSLSDTKVAGARRELPQGTTVASPPVAEAPTGGSSLTVPAEPAPVPAAVPEVLSVAAMAAMPDSIPGPHERRGGPGAAHPPRSTPRQQQAGPGASLPPPRRVSGGVSPIVYMALGAFLLVVVVAAVAYYSHSAEATPSTTPAPIAATPPTPEPATPTPSPEAPAPPAPESAAAPPIATSSPATPAADVAPAQTDRGTSPSTAAVPPAERPSSAARGTASRGVGPAAVSREPAAAVADVDAPAPAPSRDAPPAAVQDEQALDALEAELDRLSARAAAISTSVNRLRDEQARMGLGLSREMAARQHSLDTNLSKAMDAFERRDLARARRFQALAESDVQFLEKAFGR